MSAVDVLAKALFEAYSRNSGNPPECHYNRAAAEQWMAQAIAEVGVAELIEAAAEVLNAFRAIGNDRNAITPPGLVKRAEEAVTRLDAVVASIGGAA